MATLRIAPLLLAALVSACGAGSGGGGAGTIPLRSGMTVVWQGSVTTGDDEVQCAFQPDVCRSDRLRVMDVARDGQRIVVTARHMNNNPLLFVSDDLGATWTTHPLPSSNDRVEGNDRAGASWFYGVHAYQGHIYLAVSGSHLTSTTFPIFQVMEVNPGLTDYAGSLWLGLDATHFEGFTATQVTTQYDPRADGYGNVFQNTFDLQQMKGTGGTTHPFDGATTYASSWTTIDGRTWFGITGAFEWNGTSQGLRHCLVVVSPTMGMAPFCRPRLLSPVTLGAPDFVTRLGNGLYVLYEQGGHVFATAPSAQVGLPFSGPHHLGPGRVGGETYSLIHPRHAGFAVVNPLAGDKTSRPKLRRVNADGTVDTVEIPSTPCERDDQVCGKSLGVFDAYGDLQVLVPLDGGEYLALYLISRDLGDGNAQVLLASREKPVFTPFQDPPPAPSASPLPALPDARGASELERACTRAVACGAYRNLVACLSDRSMLRGGTDALDRSYQRFLSASREPGCFALRHVDVPVWPTCRTGCVDGWAVSRCGDANLPEPQATDCGSQHRACVEDSQGPHCGDPLTTGTCQACIAADGGASCLSVAECADVGLECRGDPEAPASAACTRTPCPFGAPACQDGVAGWCGGATFTESCSRLGRSCNEQGTACEPILADQLQCPVQQTQCQGDFLVWCRADGVRALDCKSLGFSGCQSSRFYDRLTEGSCVP